MDINVPKKIRLLHNCDNASDPLCQAADAITRIYRRLRIAWPQLARTPPRTVLGQEQALDLLYVVVMHGHAADKALFDTIGKIYAQISSADLSDTDTSFVMHST